MIKKIEEIINDMTLFDYDYTDAEGNVYNIPVVFDEYLKAHPTFVKHLAKTLASALELDEGKVKDLVKYPPLIRPIVDGILQPLKIPEWQVENPKALIKALCSKYKEGELNK